MDLSTLRLALEANDLDATEQLRAAVAARRDQRSGHLEWAGLCEEAGEHGLAFTEYQLALRDEPGNPDLLTRLAVLYEERGEAAQAVGCATRLWTARADGAAFDLLGRLLIDSEAIEQAAALVADATARGLASEEIVAFQARLGAEHRRAADGDDPADASIPGQAPCGDADIVRFAHLFSGRENVHARQWCSEQGEVGYSPVREPFTVREARNHLLGSVTAGVYVVRLDDTVTFFALDIDITKRAIARARGSITESRLLRASVAAEALRQQAAMEALGMAPLLEDSGYKGRHLWVFLEQPESATVVRQFGALFLAHYPVQHRDLHSEFFPKQASAGSGIGNLIKLPLGIHRKTGRRSHLLRPDGSPDSDPFAALRSHPRLDRGVLRSAMARLRDAPVSVAVAVVVGPEDDEHAPPPLTPAPPMAAAAWTAADFDTNREIAHLLNQCPVLAALRSKAEQNRRLIHDERLVLTHALGHSGSGVLAVNYLMELCVDAPRSDQLQSPLAGNPISCPKIRKRIPHITGTVDCHCAFPWAPDHYPTPRLHLDTLPPSVGPATPSHPVEAPPWDPVDRARALGVLWAQRARLAGEIAGIERDLLAWMEQNVTTTIDTGDGTLVGMHEPGAPDALVWEPRAVLPPAGTSDRPGPPGQQDDQAPSGREALRAEGG